MDKKMAGGGSGILKGGVSALSGVLGQSPN